jgi:outer membrane cobalamin receptor
MTIEIQRDDLLALAEACKATPGSMMLMLKNTDGKRCTLVVTATPKRTRRRRAGAAIPLVAAEASAD